jgi:hypothetical protein
MGEAMLESKGVAVRFLVVDGEEAVRGMTRVLVV